MVGMPALVRNLSSGPKSIPPRADSTGSSGGRKKVTRTQSEKVSRSNSGSSKRSGLVTTPKKQLSFKREKSFKSERKTQGFSEEVSNSLKNLIETSPTLSSEAGSFLNYYVREEVSRGGKLVSGEFFDIYRVKQLPDGDLDDASFSGDPYASDMDNDSGRNQNSNNTKNNSSNSSGMNLPPKKYVLKQLSKKHMSEKLLFQQAALRLALEAKYLARLDHPNIVQARGLPYGEEQPLMNGGLGTLFIIREHMVETLEQRLVRWQKDPRPDDGIFDPNSRNVRRKIKYVMALAEALHYLHERNIAVLNLRPENIGFLEDGTIQIHNLSCCREMIVNEEVANDDKKGEGPLGFDCALKVKEHNADSVLLKAKSNFLVLEATGLDGVPRYVAPEAMVDNMYKPAADTYSWAHIFFELLTLSKPYAHFKLGEHLTRVCVEGHRPSLSVYKFPKPLEDLFCMSWRSTYSKRPSMQQLLQAIPLLMKLTAGLVTTPQA